MTTTDRTATGIQLGDTLRTIGALADADLLPRHRTAGVKREIRRLFDRLRRDAALNALIAVLDPDGVGSTWQHADLIADALAVFQRAGYQRCLSGGRQPSAVERHLMALIEVEGPQSRERLYRELTLLRQ